METFTFLDDNKIKKRITITPYKDNQWKCDCEGITDWHEFVCTMLGGLSFAYQEILGRNEFDILDILPDMVTEYCNDRKSIIYNDKENKID